MTAPTAYALLGLPIHAVTTAEAEEILRDAIRTRRRCFLSTPNLNFLAAAQTDLEFRRSVLESDLIVADGMPLIWLARLLGIPLPERVAGSSLFERLRRRTDEAPIRVFFFGGMPGVAEHASVRLNSESGGISAVGFLDPGMGDIESMSSQSVIDYINHCNPDFVVVALGAKKGQAWIQRNRDVLTAPILSHLGAVINFSAGTIQRAPVWIQRSGMEWLWRLKEESHLLGRYLNDGLWLIRTLFRIVLPLAIRPQRRRIKYSACLEFLDGGEIIRISGQWTHGDLGTLREAKRTYKSLLPRQNLQIDLSGLVEIAPAVMASMFDLLNGLDEYAPSIIPPPRSSAAYRQLASNMLLGKEV